jgi:hypothetical protein
MKFLPALRALLSVVAFATTCVIAQVNMEDGDVFGLVTIRPGSDYAHLRPVYTLADGTLALSNFDGTAKEFRGVSFDEFGIIFTPEPIRVLNLQPDHTLKFEDSLYGPTIGWAVDGMLELNSSGNAVICPTIPGDRIYWASDGFTCQGSIEIDLMTVPVKTRSLPVHLIDEDN